MHDVTVTVIVGMWQSELFLFPRQPDGHGGQYLPMVFGGEKIFLTPDAAKELSEKLLEFVNAT